MRSAPAEAQVTIKVDADNPGIAIPADYSGLGFEVAILRPENGTHYFRPDNPPLINLFHTLGIKSLRLGGNTSDRDVRQLPSEADLDNLFGFAKAAGVKVIYCLRLHNGDPTVDAQTVKYIMDHYAPQVDCFSIGQEPSAYPTGSSGQPAQHRSGWAHRTKNITYASYREDWKKFADAIIAAVPDVKFCGPSVHNNGEWARRFMEDFGRSNHVALDYRAFVCGRRGRESADAGNWPRPDAGR